MSKLTIRDLLMKTIDKYIESKPQINEDLNVRKMQNIKETIPNDNGMFESCITLFKKASPEKYIELTNIINIPNII